MGFHASLSVFEIGFRHPDVLRQLVIVFVIVFGRRHDVLVIYLFISINVKRQLHDKFNLKHAFHPVIIAILFNEIVHL